MLIGIDTSRANKKLKTGTEWYSYFLVEYLKKLDNKNNYLLYTNKKLSAGLEICPANFKEKKLKWPLPRFWTQCRLSLEMLFNKCDLLFVPAHALPVIRPKKSVVTIHDVGFERFPKVYPWYDIIYHKFAVWFAAKFSKKIITISEFSKREIMDVYNVAEEKIKVIHIGFDNKDFKVINDQKKIDQVLEKYKIKKPYLFYIGRLEEKKNIYNLVKAFSKAVYHKPEYKLVLVGNPGYGFERIEELIKKKGLEKNIIMPGWVEQEHVPYLMNATEIFVFPSLYEGFGIPPLEAMACGVPVCCSNAASLPEVVADAAVMFNPKDVDDMYAKILSLINDKLLQFNLKQKGFERIKKFNWEKCAQETLKVFDEM